MCIHDHWQRKARSAIRSMRSRHVSTTPTVNQLLRLFDEQRFLCALTGRRLEPDSTTLDHRTPLSGGGDNSLSNLQWICVTANVAKGRLSQAQFVELCRQVSAHMSL